MNLKSVVIFPKITTAFATAGNSVSSGWVSASLSGIKYGPASTPTVVVTR